MKIIGLTGSMGMGKSFVGKVLKRMRIPVFDCDAEIHEFYKNIFNINYKNHSKIFNTHFHEFVVDGVVNRKLLANYVYANPDKRKLLESIMKHVLVDQLLKFVRTCRMNNKKIIVLDVPLLYETRMDKFCDFVMVVACPDFLQEQRVLSRAGYTKQRLEDVKKLQLPSKEKIKRSDFFINTGGSKGATCKAVKKILLKL